MHRIHQSVVTNHDLYVRQEAHTSDIGDPQMRLIINNRSLSLGVPAATKTAIRVKFIIF